MNEITHLSVYVMEDPTGIARQSAEIIEKLCKEALAERGVFNIAISGGKTPVPLFKLLSSPAWVDRLHWEKINLYWVDERGVPPEHPDSNYRVAREELLSYVPATKFYRIRGELDPQEAAEAYEKLLISHFNLEPGELPRFDCVILGMGADGHVASLFPGISEYIETNHLVIDLYVQKLHSSRITMTLPVLNNARSCLFLVSGREKHDAISSALNLLTHPELPAQKVRPINGELLWVIDEAAAQG